MLVLRSERCNPMKETDIRKYAGLMKELGLTGLEITEENSKVRLERSVGAPAKEMVYSVPEPADDRTDESVFLLEIFNVSESDDHIAVMTFPVRHHDADNAGPIIKKLH